MLQGAVMTDQPDSQATSQKLPTLQLLFTNVPRYHLRNADDLRQVLSGASGTLFKKFPQQKQHQH